MEYFGFGFFELAGLAGVAFYLGSYGALQTGFLKGSSYVYALLNFAAAALVLVSLLQDFNLSSAIIQLSWIVISTVGLFRIYYVHHAIRFSDLEQKMINQKLPNLPKDVARKFFNSGEWKTVAPGSELMREGEAIENFYYISKGSATVSRFGRVIANCNSNEFIGEITCFSGDPATGTVRLISETKLFQINTEILRQIAPSGSPLRQTIEHAIADDLRLKLAQRGKMVEVDDESLQNSMGLLKDIELVSTA